MFACNRITFSSQEEAAALFMHDVSEAHRPGEIKRPVPED